MCAPMDQVPYPVAQSGPSLVRRPRCAATDLGKRYRCSVPVTANMQNARKPAASREKLPFSHSSVYRETFHAGLLMAAAGRVTAVPLTAKTKLFRTSHSEDAMIVRFLISVVEIEASRSPSLCERPKSNDFSGPASIRAGSSAR
jgi:hypothetical protein